MNRNKFESKIPSKEADESLIAKYDKVALKIIDDLIKAVNQKTEEAKNQGIKDAIALLKKLISLKEFRDINPATLKGPVKKHDEIIRRLQARFLPDTIDKKPVAAREAWLSEEAPGVPAKEVIAAEEYGAKEREKMEEEMEMIEADLEEIANEKE